jgi:hypothetical protein
MRDLYTRLSTEEINVDENIYTVGDSILSSFYYGNFSQGVEELQDISCNAKDLLEYIEQEAEGYDMRVDELYHGHFSNDFWIDLGGSI